jgi:formylglycine-generating enzyme required for sulfatase activity
MKNPILLLLLFLGTTTQAQVLVKMNPKEDQSKTSALKPKTVVKTKIIYVDKPAKPKIVVKPKTSFEPEMVFVEGGTFNMGGNDSGQEEPIHSVTLNSFKMGKFEVTVAQYKAYCKASGTKMPVTPSWGWKDNHPMVNVNFYEATAYCIWLSEKTSKDYRLPTEAEWEFAARGGNKNSNYTYSGSEDLEEVGWFNSNSAGSTQESGKKLPNEQGIFDMAGNVWEWCKDWFDYGYISNPTNSNPRGPSSGVFRVVRGGSWNDSNALCRVASREYCYPDFKNEHAYRHDNGGFRLVLSQ